MRLLRLELQGFKSFAEKTTIDFGPGVTGIVGPNGCGKSNISDGIRWVLGEQSLKSLRGSKSEDVIFSGSSARRALNLAEVSLTFDNKDQFFPLDYEEVTVGRRIYRSGEGVYLINRKPCRLKDVVDLFRDTGLGKDALAVLGQNKIDELLSCTPEERRSAFEELAGISRYKNRKKDALKRLEQTEQNLLRVQDLMVTMAEELPGLAEAKKKTEAYQEIKKEMRSGELRWIASEWDKLSLQENKLKEEEKGFADADQLAEESRLKRAALMAELTQKMIEGESALKAWQDEQEKTQSHIQEIRMEIAIQSERLEQNASLNNMLLEDESKGKEGRQEILGQIKDLEQKLTQAKDIYLEKKNEFTKAQEEQAKIQKRWNEIQSLLESGRDDGFSSLQEIVTLRNRNQSLQDDLQRYNRQNEKLSQEKDLLTRQNQEILQENSQLETEHQKNQLEIQKAEGSISDTQKNLLQCQKEKNEFGRILEKDRSEEQDMRLRLRWLSDMLENHEGFSHGVRSLLQAKSLWRQGILGTVAELFEVQPEYRTALEVALGGTMQNIICKTETEAREGIAFLKNQKAGRVTFLPLTTLQIGGSSKEEALLDHPGCLGRASEFVKSPKEVEKAVKFLLYRTLIVDTMETALSIGKASKFSTRIVTLQGEILRPGGSITGGSTGKERESFWSRREELEKVTASLKIKEKEISVLSEKQAKLQNLYEVTQKSLDKWNDDIQELRTKGRVYEEQKSHFEQRSHFVCNEIHEIDEEYKEIQNQIHHIKESVHQVELELKKAQLKEEDRKGQIEKLQNEYGQLDGDKDMGQQNLTRIQVETFGCEQECQHLSDRLSDIRTALESEAQALADIQQKLLDIQNLQKQGEERLSVLKNTQRESEDSFEVLQENTLKAEKYWKDLQATKQEREKEEILLEREESKLREKRHDWEMRLQRLSFEQEKWKIHLEEEFQMDIAAALAEADLEISLKGLSDRLAVLRNRLGEIGEVNPYAIEEYERHHERYSFYETQSGDLQSARQSLQRLLNELNKEMSEQFKETFDKVSEKFRRIFLELFGGGKAELSLTDPSHILETGVEIFVQPPGKKLQNMTLLSGGERALTVIALLFAFMECRPSPFYLADEVDAALDEANVRRFSQFLKEYSEHSQFIVVTHRRGTMEIADTLHGITMESAGISKLVSVRFEGNQPDFVE